jgi:hypothetical protein
VRRRAFFVAWVALGRLWAVVLGEGHRAEPHHGPRSSLLQPVGQHGVEPVAQLKIVSFEQVAVAVEREADRRVPAVACR